MIKWRVCPLVISEVAFATKICFVTELGFLFAQVSLLIFTKWAIQFLRSVF